MIVLGVVFICVFFLNKILHNILKLLSNLYCTFRIGQKRTICSLADTLTVLSYFLSVP